MPKQSAYQQYKQVQVKTANRGKLLLMLYDGCLKFLKKAKKNIKEEDIMGANDNLIRAQDIIRELMNTLNFEQGGEVAANLEALYDYMLQKLIEANVKKDIKKVEHVENMLQELHESWQQIIEGQKEKEEKPQLNMKR